MGILNVTPDSFSNAQPLLDPAAAVEAGLRMAADGADVIDVGGESTRPGAVPLSTADELARVLPVIRGLAVGLEIPISIDTYKAEVAHAALAEGAAIVNDVSGLRRGPELARVVARERAALIVMHSRGTPETMSDLAIYADLMAEVIAELRASIAVAAEAAVALEQLIVDPGVGFAKRTAHSYGVLARLPELAAALDRPLLVGASRKGFMRDASSGREAADRDWGTAAAVSASVLGGAHIVRVHAVAEMVQVVRVAEEIRRHQS
jgi:dihydropteroate synthase